MKQFQENNVLVFIDVQAPNAVSPTNHKALPLSILAHGIFHY